ncbi:MAG: tRNA lysidine(34) synthetase TilS [Prevotella sp.]|nr:tRNA lysidine(34) synthetase TilS [Prevotella sp.]
MPFLSKIQAYIVNNRLLELGEKIIAGLSGGADSVAMLHILRSLGYTCVAAHCNFHLRGEESDRDELFVRNFCREQEIELHTVSFDTYNYIKTNGLSLEMAARELRYQWFEELSQTLGVNKIAVAHHQDDSVETMLINLVRGSGIKGLTGILPKNGKIIRPLLCVSRKEIREYLKVNKLPFVEDSSNAEDVFLRNKIRLNILPELEKSNPAVRRNISRTSAYLKTVEAIYRQQIDRIINQVFANKTIDIRALSETDYPETVLFEILHPYGFNAATIEKILEAATGISGKIFFSDNYRLLKDRNTFRIERKNSRQAGCFYIEERATTVHVPLKLTLSCLKKDVNFRLEKNKNILYADKSQLTFPLCIRKWRQGDRFTPFGMNGSKKLSDYFSDRKFSLSDKENTWLLCNADGRIIWIIGERSDNRFRISEKTSDVLKIEVIADETAIYS